MQILRLIAEHKAKADKCRAGIILQTWTSSPGSSRDKFNAFPAFFANVLMRVKNILSPSPPTFAIHKCFNATALTALKWRTGGLKH